LRASALRSGDPRAGQGLKLRRGERPKRIGASAVGIHLNMRCAMVLSLPGHESRNENPNAAEYSWHFGTTISAPSASGSDWAGAKVVVTMIEIVAHKPLRLPDLCTSP